MVGRMETEVKKYNSIVVDTNAIIRGAGLNQLRPSSDKFYTVPGVLSEIRDKKARQHLESLPFELITREPSKLSCRKVADFARQTGDYRELSLVDLQVIALQYELEVEGCGDAEHLRKEPKRKLGLGFQYVKKDNDSEGKTNNGDLEKKGDDKEKSDETATNETPTGASESGLYAVEVEENEDGEEESESESESEIDSELEDNESSNNKESGNSVKAWSSIVDSSASKPPKAAESFDVNATLNQPFGSMDLTGKKTSSPSKAEILGQFDDADEDDSSDDGDYADSDAEFSDEDCDIYVLDPEEVEARKQGDWKGPTADLGNKPSKDSKVSFGEDTIVTINDEFPSLADAAKVPYEGSDDEEDYNNVIEGTEILQNDHADQKTPKKQWDSFGKYKKLMSSNGIKSKEEKEKEFERKKETMRIKMMQEIQDKENKNTDKKKDNSSRIIGGTGFSGQSEQVDDDGEGWITVDNFKHNKMNGFNGFTASKQSNNQQGKKNGQGKDIDKSLRTACATTDFAMQNVILQMGLDLLSIDGVVVKKVKQWVVRCASCFTVYAGGNNKLGGRLFCDSCGSPYLDRISASVDAKTGRYRLHLSKRYKPNKRGTKFSLPNPGQGDRHQGDLLLREDQMMMGAWHQKVKKGYKEQGSMFGSDITSQVGLTTGNISDLTKRSDIMVGFGRRNPNSTKFGRERRGKKKKASNKACGLRRY